MALTWILINQVDIRSHETLLPLGQGKFKDIVAAGEILRMASRGQVLLHKED